jgi:hypothetical protein
MAAVSARSAAVPLSRALFRVCSSQVLARHCGHKLERKGSWFQTASHYRCGACHQEVSVSYDDKVKLLPPHARNDAAAVWPRMRRVTGAESLHAPSRVADRIR